MTAPTVQNQRELVVTAAPLFDPGAARIDVRLPAGLTLSAIIDFVLPHLAEHDRARLRVTLVTPAAVWPVEAANWDKVRPKPKARILIRVVPTDDALQIVLSIVVTIAATAIAGPLGASLSLTAFGTQLLTIGLTFLGNTLLNSIFNSSESSRVDEDRDKATYRISGFRNEAKPGDPIPTILGTHRFSPPYALPPYTEIVGDEQYIRAAFVVGSGPLALSNLQLGDTPIDRFDEVEVETRLGYDTDEPLTLTPNQIIEEQFGTELTRPFPRDDQGEVIDGAFTVETPVARFSATDAQRCAIIIGFPTGLIRYGNSGRRHSRDVEIRIRQRLNGVGGWTNVADLTISAKKSAAFFRTHEWTVPVRGRYEIEITRMSPESLKTSEQDRTTFVALQSIRPEYPINAGPPLALVALRIKATAQLSRSLDNFNLVASRITKDWDSATEVWVERETRNPASAFRHILQHTENALPLSDVSIALDGLADWHDFCVAKGLKYDRVHDFAGPQLEILGEIAAAGRAAPRHDGVRYGVVIDRPDNLVIDHVNSRNARSFKWSKSYTRPPDGLRVSFLDETNAYVQAERIIPWPGHVGPVVLSEEIRLPGKTDPDEIWIETRRRQHELDNRTERFSALQDGTARSATRGDLVMMAFDTLQQTDATAEVRRVVGNQLVLTGQIEMDAVTTYAIRFKLPSNDPNTPDESVLRSVQSFEGIHSTLAMTGTGEAPLAGTIVHFGPAGSESLPVYVGGTEAGEDNTTVISMIPQMAVIDTLTDAEVPPAWDGRVGEISDANSLPPAVPRISSITFDDGPENIDDSFVVILEPGTGSVVPVSTYSVFHRAAGASIWVELAAVSSAEAAVSISAYDYQDDVEIEVLATGANAVNSARLATVSYTVGEAQVRPDAPSGGVDGGLGYSTLMIGTPPPANFETIIVRRGATNDFALASVVATLANQPANSTITHVDGDATKPDLITNGDFDTGLDWASSVSWTLVAGQANHVAGSSGELEQVLALTDAATLRLLVEISGRTAGTLDVKLTGGTTTDIASLSTDDSHLLNAVIGTGNTTLSLQADAAFDGSVNRVVAFIEATGSVPQGDQYYWVSAANDEGGESSKTSLPVTTII